MARPRNDLVERQKVLELLDVEIADWMKQRQDSKRFSTQWERASAALASLIGRRKAVASMPGYSAAEHLWKSYRSYS